MIAEGYIPNCLQGWALNPGFLTPELPLLTGSLDATNGYDNCDSNVVF